MRGSASLLCISCTEEMSAGVSLLLSFGLTSNWVIPAASVEGLFINFYVVSFNQVLRSSLGALIQLSF